LDRQGGVRRGFLPAASQAEAAARLRAEGLTPVRLRAAEGGAGLSAVRRLNGAQLAEQLFLLGELAGAGSSLTTGLSVLRAQATGPRAALLAELQRRIASGERASEAFANALGTRATHVSALIAAGETSGDLPGALRTAAAQIERDQALRGAFWSAVSYPLFILVATAVALLVLLGVVAPSLEPLLAELDANVGPAIRIFVGLSALLRQGWPLLLIGSGVVIVALGWAWRVGALTPWLDKLALDGPARGVSRRLIYGRAAAVLGRLMAAGVPAPQAFRLAVGTVPMRLARTRLEAAAGGIYQGAAVSTALGACAGMPLAIRRMAEVGEQSGGLGSMLERAGDLEQAAALRRIEATANWLGPALIVLLGGLIGSIMAALLGAVSSLGSAVLN
jgi:type II secretory pathway component PulF